MAEVAHPKGVLLERAQKLALGRPEFKTERTGPEHEPSFLSDVLIDGEVLGTGQGSSKRTAEKNAAQEALAALDERESATKPAVPAQKGKSRRSRGGKTTTATAGATEQAPATDAAAAKSRPAPVQAASLDETDDGTSESDDDAPFTGPWPMFDDLLAAVLGVAEKRVSSELRGEAARTAIRDFSLSLYKELLSDLGEVVDDDDEDEDEEDDD